MNYILKYITLLITFAFFMQVCNAQDEVKVTTKKTTIDGKFYYIHTVKKGETLNAISKAYNVPQKDIVMENPIAMEGLKPESTLKIPVIEDRSKYIYHTIEKGQTLYSIAKKYNVDISELQKNNPGIANGLKAGMELKIGKKPEVTTDVNKKNNETDKTNETKKESSNEDNKSETKKEIKENSKDELITHTVEKGQTLYALAKKYNVTEAQLKEANPEIENGLKVGSILKIPTSKAENKKETISVSSNENKRSTETKKEPVSKETTTAATVVPCNEFNYASYKKPFRIAMLAPFHITQNRGYVLKGKKKDEEPPIYPKSIKFIEFYQGMLLALDSLKNAGISTEMLVYDTEKDSTKIANITQKKEFENLDLIVGPFFSTNLRHFSDFAKNNNIPIISPLSQSRDFLKDNPYAFQVNPSNITQVNEAANYFSDSKEVNYIIINTGKKDDSLLALQFKTKIFEYYNAKFKTDPPHFLELKYKVAGFKGIQEAINKEIDNVIFIPAIGETFVANILNKLNTLKTKYPIYLLGMQSWYTEDNIEQDYLFNLQYTYFSSMYVDYARPDVSNFVSQYRRIYSADPTKYSFQGYDIIIYFVSALKQFGKNFPNCIASDTLINKCGLQTEFRFNKPDEKSGFENTKTFLIQYDKEFNISHINGVKKIEKEEVEQDIKLEEKKE